MDFFFAVSSCFLCTYRFICASSVYQLFSCATFFHIFVFLVVQLFFLDFEDKIHLFDQHVLFYELKGFLHPFFTYSIYDADENNKRKNFEQYKLTCTIAKEIQDLRF